MAYHPIDVHVGRRMRELREQKGLSQKDIAKAINISFQQVQKYESGANRLSMSRSWEFCRHLRADITELFEGLPRDLADVPAKEDERGSRQSLELSRSFAEVTDQAARRQILALCKTLARLDQTPHARITKHSQSMAAE